MTRSSDTEARVDRRSRIWWLVPLCVVVSTAVAVTVLLAPQLGAHVAVPQRLVLAATPAPTSSPPPTRRPKRPAAPSPTPSAITSPPAAPSSEVVQPQRPVVTVHGDDGSEREPADR